MVQLFLKYTTHFVQTLVVLICLLFVFSKRTRDQYTLFALGWALILIFDLGMVVWGWLHPVNNNWVYNIAFPIIQLCCLWFLIGQLNWRFAWLPVIGFLCFAIVNWIFLQGMEYLNTYSLALGGVMIFLAASVRMFQLWQEDTSNSLFSDPDFWICTGFIIYWGTETPFFSLYHFLYKNFESFFTTYFNFVHLGITIVLNICIAIGLQCKITIQKK